MRPSSGRPPPLALLELLTDPGDAGPGGPAGVEAVSQLRRSIRAELERLLNTRAFLREGDAAGDEPSVLSYGVQDLGLAQAASPADRERLADHLARQVRRFEPRLVDVAVRVMPAPAPSQLAQIEIQARLPDAASGEEGIAFAVTVPAAMEGGA